MANGEEPIANPSVVLREEFDDWAVLFDPDTGRGFGLNPTGVYLWKLLDGGHTADALLEKIRTFADGVPEEAGEDVRGFIEELVREGLAGFDVSQLGRGVGCRKTADTAAVHPGGCYDASSGPVSGAKRCTYEPPKLVNLSESTAVVHGSCENGSGDFGNCFSGGGPTFQCGNGSSAPNSMCCTGGAPGNASECVAGDCPHRCANCYHGGGFCQFGYSAGTGTQCATGDGGT